MELVFRIAPFLSGIVNLLPFMLFFLPEKISQSYGITVSDPNLELLLRHRAVLFGIVGCIMLFSALTKTNYLLATLIGLVSMLSFVFLYFSMGGINQELKTVMIVDVITSFVLLAVALTYRVVSKTE